MEKQTKVIVSAETSKYERGMRNMRRTNAQTTQAMKKAWGGVKTALIAVSGAAVMGAVIKKSLNMADAIGKASDAIGISTDTLQEYRHAARIAGVDTGELDKSMLQFSKRLGEARAGTGAMITYLRKYDESLLENMQSAKSTDEAMQMVFDTMGDMTNAADKAALANAAFGRSGVKMTVMVKEGADALRKMRQEARDLGIVMDEDLIRNAEKANDELEKLWRVIKVQFMSAAVGLAPEIAKIAQHTTDWWKANQDLVKTDVAHYIGKIKTVMEGIKSIYDSLPSGVIGPVGVGLITTMLLGPAAGVTLGLITLLVQEMTKLNNFKWDDLANVAASRLGSGGIIGPGTKGYDIYAPSESGGGNGDTMGGNGEIDLATAAPGFDFEAKNEALADYYETQKEITEGFRQWDLESAMAYDEALIEGHHATNDAIVEGNRNAQNQMVAMDKQAAAYKIQIAKGLGTALLTVSGASNTAIFLATKAFDIGMAIMSAHVAAARALAEVPFPANIAVSAKMLTLGYLQAAAIGATAIGQIAASSGGGTSGGGTYTSPMVTTPSGMTEYQTMPEKERGRTLTINIHGDYIGDEGYVEMLAEKISEAVEDKDVTLIASNAQYAGALT